MPNVYFDGETDRNYFHYYYLFFLIPSIPFCLLKFLKRFTSGCLTNLQGDVLKWIVSNPRSTHFIFNQNQQTVGSVIDR